MAEYMGEIAIIIVNLEKADAVLSLGLLCPGSWAVLRSWESVARVGSDLVFSS